MKFNLDADFGDNLAGASAPASTKTPAPSELFQNIPAPPDALVLVAANIICSCCRRQSTNIEPRTFLRYGNGRRGDHYTINRQDKLFTAHLPREIKMLNFSADYCIHCFMEAKDAVDPFIEKACTVADPILSSLNPGAAVPELET